MDIQELKERVSIIEILEHYGWEDDTGQHNTGWGEWMKTRCPFHHDTNPSAAVSMDRNLFHCFVCGDDRAMDILDVVMREEYFDTVKEAKQWVERNFL